ncbi:nuclear transport factor 2 family protein [Haematobacter massiliensis]|uniref:Ketosteroid isomerase n=1 Tax=Haematobacter massiliensis TaxID=195105 RepID=A0A086Y6Q9_9RHOB|nr:nuclear transport factor 2 family protein [Haematobacter massiliensis]KFI29959.1 ketosteroid isomerase [Haematobacter massiliensis]OWJ69445.1 nuclear transport factor 2 family protein [Haematobacter massiliensis]OWJ86898.1 nuclear transport factor 2 family protein [Haematobacter massiliensis]QBJ25466.1 nuclear transport factor 2 family protein [Haematobacter massiliensis]
MTIFSSSPEDRALADELEARRYRAMQAGDATALDAMLDDDLSYTHSFGDRDSKASYLDKLRAGFFQYHELRPVTEQVIRRGDVLVLVGSMWARATVNGQDRVIDNVCTSVWAMRADEWRFLAFSPTPLKR